MPDTETVTSLISVYDRAETLYGKAFGAWDRYRDDTSLALSDRSMSGFITIIDRIIELEPMDLWEAQFQLKLALEAMAFEPGDRLDDNARSQPEHVAAARRAIVNMWKFAGTKADA